MSKTFWSEQYQQELLVVAADPSTDPDRLDDLWNQYQGVYVLTGFESEIIIRVAANPNTREATLQAMAKKFRRDWNQNGLQDRILNAILSNAALPLFIVSQSMFLWDIVAVADLAVRANNSRHELCITIWNMYMDMAERARKKKRF